MGSYTIVKIKKETCPYCRGKGKTDHFDGDGIKTCDTCNGRGKVKMEYYADGTQGSFYGY